MLKHTIFEQLVKPILPYFIIIFSFVTVILMFTNTITFLLQTLRKPIMLIKTRIALCLHIATTINGPTTTAQKTLQDHSVKWSK